MIIKGNFVWRIKYVKSSNIKCPRCGSELRLMKFNVVNINLARIVMYCPKCKISYEIEIEYKDFIEKYSEIKSEYNEIDDHRLSPDVIPPNVPKAIKFLVSLQSKSCIPIYYRKIMNNPPQTGSEIELNYLLGLGIPKETARKLLEYLRSRGIYKLYKFQEKAIKFGLSGENLIIVAPTGTGKTEAFAIPAMTRAAQFKKDGTNPPIVLIIYPTKALARDQLSKLFDYADIFGLSIGALDGDTPNKLRKKLLLKPPDVLLTNFDMINYHMGKRTNLGRLFHRARIIIIDEMHQYSGAFGTHVHYIIKRLKRIAGASKKLQFYMASATISNPLEFGEQLMEEKAVLISETGRKTPLFILFMYCLDPIHYAAAKLLIEILKQNIKTLIFFNTRKSAELAFHILRRMALRHRDLLNKFDLHRAGLPKGIRKEIEIAFKRGKKVALLATPTLELGIDIGDIDLVLSEITPVNRFIQRSGRSGRRTAGSAVLLMRRDDPISDYYLMNPRDYFEDVSLCYIEPKNQYIAEKHIYLMAFEKPLDQEEITALKLPMDVILKLIKEGAIFRLGKKYYANGNLFNRYFPRNIRGSDKIVRVIYNNKVIDEREAIIAIRELHPGAIYINRGIKYLVKSLDLNSLQAVVEKAPREYDDLYTRPIYTSGAIPVGEIVQKEVLGTKIFYGKLQMRATVEGYIVFQEGMRKPLAEYALETPVNYTYETRGLVFKAPELNYEDKDLIAGSYHALEHVIIEGTNVITGGGSEDLGGISFGTTGVIVIYDSTPGGNGVSRILFERFEKAVDRAYKILLSCKCGGSEICNKCVYSYRCGNNNQPLYQPGAKELLERMLKKEIVVDADRAIDIITIMEKGIV